MPKSTILGTTYSPPSTRLREDVLGLEIAMHDAVVVGVAPGPRAPAAKAARPARGQLPDSLQLGAEVATIEQLHHDVGRLPLREAEVEHAHDVAVLDPRREPRLLDQAFVLLLAGHFFVQELDCDVVAEGAIVREPNRSHPARAHHPQELVLVRDDLPGACRTGALGRQRQLHPGRHAVGRSKAHTACQERDGTRDAPL